MQPSETLLIEGLKHGEEAAFRQLVERFQDRVYNTCLGFVKNEDDADDLAQEVFIEVHRSIGRFREEASLSTWIYRVAVNKSLEWLRKQKLRTRVAQFFGSGDHRHRDVPDFNHPGLLEEKKETARVLFQAIGRLPEQQRTAFTLHKIEGLSYEDIGAIMRKSISSVQSLMHRARINLQEDLRTYYEKNMD
jgi:RNA polymerase sigma factor (sigma-70 family)